MRAVSTPGRVARSLALLVLAVTLLAPATTIARAGETESIDLQIQVVPPPAGETGPDDQPVSAAGTISVALTGSGQLAGPWGMQASSFDLVVVDERPVAPGWRIVIQVASGGEMIEPPVLARYVTRTEHLAGKPLKGTDGPRGRRLSIGQPLARPTTVMLAGPGAGVGIYRVRFAVTSEMPPVEPGVLIVAIDTAP